MNYVKTQFGNIHINDIPVVTQQTTDSKLNSAFMFFGVIVLIIIVFLYVIKWAPNPYKKERVVVKGFTDKVATTITATNIDVYDTDELYLENIVLVTADDNIIDINVLKNAYVQVIKKDDGILYSLDFKAELEIKEIILISSEDPAKYISHINIDLYNYGNKSDINPSAKVWEYSAFLPNLRENSILISKQVFKPSDWHVQTLSTGGSTTEKNIRNERELSLTLTENSECYTSY
jgi:hypothetical protein